MRFAANRNTPTRQKLNEAVYRPPPYLPTNKTHHPSRASLQIPNSTSPLNFLEQTSVDNILAPKGIQPWVGNPVNAVRYAGQGAGNRAGGVRIVAEVDGLQDAARLAARVGKAPERGLERIQDVAAR